MLALSRMVSRIVPASLAYVPAAARVRGEVAAATTTGNRNRAWKIRDALVCVCGDMLGVAAEQSQIFNSIVGLVPIDVVDDFTSIEKSSDVALHNEAMLSNLVSHGPRMLRCPYMDIPLMINVSAAIPLWISASFVTSSHSSSFLWNCNMGGGMSHA
jgi:hypothetical protein